MKVFIQEAKNADTERRKPCEEGGRDNIYCHKPREARSHQSLEKAREDLTLEALG